MNKKNNSKLWLLQLPWLTILMVLVWLIALILITERYFAAQNVATTMETKSSIEDANSINLIFFDYNVLMNSAITLDSSTTYVDRTRPQTFFSGKADQLINLQIQPLYTQLGKVHVVCDSASHQYRLFLNQLPLGQIDSPYVIYAFQLKPQQIILIFDAEIISGNPIYTILDIQPENRRLIRQVGNYRQLITAELNSSNNCINLTFQNSMSTTKSKNYQVYQYCGDGTLQERIGN